MPGPAMVTAQPPVLLARERLRQAPSSYVSCLQEGRWLVPEKTVLPLPIQVHSFHLLVCDGEQPWMLSGSGRLLVSSEGERCPNGVGLALLVD